MQSDTNPQRRPRPHDAAQKPLDFRCGADGARCPIERSAKRIPSGREHIPAGPLDHLPQIWSWTRNDADIPPLSAAHNRVEPSTSVKRNVTVPDGRTAITPQHPRLPTIHQSDKAQAPRLTRPLLTIGEVCSGRTGLRDGSGSSAAWGRQPKAAAGVVGGTSGSGGSLVYRSAGALRRTPSSIRPLCAKRDSPSRGHDWCCGDASRLLGL